MKIKHIISFFMVAVIGLVALSGFNYSETTLGGYAIGDEAANINLMNVDRTMVSYDGFPDALGFIVIFTCNTCPYAVASEDRIIALDQEFKEKGYPVIAINPNNPDVQPADSFELMQKKAADKGFTFPYLYDESRTVYAQYGARKTPHVYLLQKENDTSTGSATEKLIVKYIQTFNHKRWVSGEEKINTKCLTCRQGKLRRMEKISDDRARCE